uniref:Uncharacterized protein n=1 Tax=Cacopsylla melanoneura TaxID=428564 RepID=A0A8D8SQT7_9HEMI
MSFRSSIQYLQVNRTMLNLSTLTCFSLGTTVFFSRGIFSVPLVSKSPFAYFKEETSFVSFTSSSLDSGFLRKLFFQVSYTFFTITKLKSSFQQIDNNKILSINSVDNILCLTSLVECDMFGFD